MVVVSRDSMWALRPRTALINEFGGIGAVWSRTAQVNKFGTQWHSCSTPAITDLSFKKKITLKTLVVHNFG